MAKQDEVELGQVLKIFWMWRDNFRAYVRRCAIRTAIYFAVGFIGMFVLVLIFPGMSWETSPADPFFFIVLPVALILSAALNLMDRIVIHEGGLEICTSSPFSRLHVASTWSDVVNIGIVEESLGAGDAVGEIYHRILYMKQTPHEVEIGNIVPIQMSTYSTGKHFSRKRYFVVDTDAFVESDFGHYFQMYAPHIVETLRKEQNWALHLTRAS